MRENISALRAKTRMSFLERGNLPQHFCAPDTIWRAKRLQLREERAFFAAIIGSLHIATSADACCTVQRHIRAAQRHSCRTATSRDTSVRHGDVLPRPCRTVNTGDVSSHKQALLPKPQSSLHIGPTLVTSRDYRRSVFKTPPGSPKLEF